MLGRITLRGEPLPRCADDGVDVVEHPRLAGRGEHEFDARDPALRDLTDEHGVYPALDGVLLHALIDTRAGDRVSLVIEHDQAVAVLVQEVDETLDGNAADRRAEG